MSGVGKRKIRMGWSLMEYMDRESQNKKVAEEKRNPENPKNTKEKDQKSE